MVMEMHSGMLHYGVRDRYGKLHLDKQTHDKLMIPFLVHDQ